MDVLFNDLSRIGWTIISFGDRGPVTGWICTLGQSFQSPAATWVSGRGGNPEKAMRDALAKIKAPKATREPVKRRRSRADEDDIV